MRILISSSADKNTLAREYIRGTREYESSIELVEFLHGDLLVEEIGTKGAFGKLVHRLHPNYFHRTISYKLLQLVETQQTDVVWIFKGFEITPDAIRKIRHPDRLLVNLNADHPWEFLGRGSGNSNVSKSLPYYDVFITYSREIERESRQRLPDLKTLVIPFGHSVSADFYQQLSQSREEIPRLCFVGNPDNHRREFLTAMTTAGVPVDVFGHGWSKHLTRNGNLRIYCAVEGDEYYRVLRKYRIQLNLFRPHNRNSHNMRSFEVPACGGIMLAPDSDEHRDFFVPDQEAFFFSGLSDAIMKAKALLAMDPENAAAIRTAARLRCERSGYSYLDRAKTAVQAIEKHLANRSQ